VFGGVILGGQRKGKGADLLGQLPRGLAEPVGDVEDQVPEEFGREFSSGELVEVFAAQHQQARRRVGAHRGAPRTIIDEGEFSEVAPGLKAGDEHAARLDIDAAVEQPEQLAARLSFADDHLARRVA
jgi:hypothetical protein